MGHLKYLLISRKIYDIRRSGEISGQEYIPNETELSFQYELIRINPKSDWSELNFESEPIRMNSWSK